MQRFGIDIGLTRQFAPATLKYVLITAAVGIVVLAGIFAAFAMYGRLDVSIVDGVANPARYWVLAIGIVIAVQLPYYVAVGVSRRSFASAGLTTMVLIGGLLAILITALFYAELRLYESLGWTQTLETGHIFNSADQSGWILIEHLLVYVIHGFAGWVVAMAFYRFKAWGLLSIPALVLAVSTGEGVAGTGWPGRVMRETGLGSSVDQLWSIPVFIVVAVGVAAALWLMIRDVPINSKAA